MTKQQKMERKAGKQRKAIDKQTSEKLWAKYMTGFFDSAYHRNVANNGKRSAA